MCQRQEHDFDTIFSVGKSNSEKLIKHALRSSWLVRLRTKQRRVRVRLATFVLLDPRTFGVR